MKRNTKDAKVKSEPKSKVKKTWRFYRSNLPTLIWDQNMDPDGGVMADFSKGHFTTTDKRIAKILKDKGYPEIGLNDEAPPNIIVNPPTQVLKDGQDVPIMSSGINEAIGQQRMDNITETVSAPEVVA